MPEASLFLCTTVGMGMVNNPPPVRANPPGLTTQVSNTYTRPFPRTRMLREILSDGLHAVYTLLLSFSPTLAPAAKPVSFSCLRVGVFFYIIFLQ